MRVEAGVFLCGVRIGQMCESIANDIGSPAAASDPQACARASQEIQRPRRRFWESAGERDAPTITLCKRGDSGTELQGESQPHRRNAYPEVRPFADLYPIGEGPDFGVGVAPVGLRLSLQLGPGISAFAEGNGGGVAFARAFPKPAARSLNFLGSAGAGLRIGSRGRRSYIVGYRFTHLSNANTAEENPGFNAHVLYLGITLH